MVGLDAQCPGPVQGTVKSSGVRQAGLGSKSAVVMARDSETRSSCGGSGHSLGEGEGSMRGQAGAVVQSKVVCVFLQHLCR